MKVGLYIDDSGYSEMNFEKPSQGNPGIGGTQYEFILLAEYLSMSSNINVIVYHRNNNTYPVKCQSSVVKDFEDATNLAAELDLFICQATIGNAADICAKKRIDVILWAHNFLRPNQIIKAANNPFVKRIVCVGKEEYRLTRLFTNKAVLIYNMVAPIEYDNNSGNHIVTYIGSLNPEKGFHVVAEQWPYIKKHITDAELWVIGSGSLYNRNKKLGKRGITESQYEDKIFSLLGVDADSVQFLGNVGLEKNSLISKTAVGVVNPTGRTETFGLSALDFAGGGAPVVGNVPIIKNKFNGYKTFTGRAFRNKVIKLLKNNQLRTTMGDNAKNFAREFWADKIIDEWISMLTETCNRDV